MLWSYHWRVLSPEKQESRGSSDTQTEESGQKWAQAPQASWFKQLTLGSLETHIANKISHQGVLVQDQQCGVGACRPCSKAPHRMPVADWMPCREAALISDNSEQLHLPGIAIALKLLVCFSSLVAYNDLMGICKQLPAWASTGTAGRPPKPRLLLGKLCSQALLLELLTNS